MAILEGFYRDMAEDPLLQPELRQFARAKLAELRAEQAANPPAKYLDDETAAALLEAGLAEREGRMN